MSPLETQPYDAARFLHDEEDCRAYLDAALEDGDPRVIAAALGAIARWKGMASVAEAAGLGRESLYKALSPEGNPRLDTLMRVIKALGFQLCTAGAPEDELVQTH